MKRRGQFATKASAWRFPRRWKSFRGVLSRCPAFHILSLLLCHLGRAEFFGTCWVGHWWWKQLGRVIWWFRGALKWENVFFFPCCSGRLRKEGIVPHSVVGHLAFFVFLFIFVWARHSYRATNWWAVLAITCWTVELYRTPDEAMLRGMCLLLRTWTFLSGMEIAGRMAQRWWAAIWEF